MYYRNPIADSRKPHILKSIVKQLAKNAVAEGSGRLKSRSSFNSKPVKKQKVGVFKLVAVPGDDRTIDMQDNLVIGNYFLIGGVEQWEAKPHTLEDSWDHYVELAEQQTQKIEKHAAKMLDQVALADPTNNGQYAMWIVKQVMRRSLVFPEDIEKVNEDLDLYHDRKKRGIIPPEHRDIAKIPSYAELFKLLEEFGGQLSDAEALQIAMGRSKTVYESPIYQVLEVSSWQLAKRLATGTAWCVRGTEMAKHYLKKPEQYPLYFIFKDGKKFALLTNLPDEKQLMDVYDRPIRDGDEEFLNILRMVADWIFCSYCDRLYWGSKESIDEHRSVAYNELMSYNLEFGQTRIPYRAHMVADVPSPLAVMVEQEPDRQIKAKPELLERKTVIGPAQAIMQISGAHFPRVSAFAEKAGFEAYDYVTPLVRGAACDECGAIQDDIISNALHALYVMEPCEDYPCCGHEPLNMGAFGCPPTFVDGRQAGMRCVCGAYVPPGNRYSICPTCLKAGEPQYEDYYEDYEEEEEDEYYDDCPVSDMEYRAKRMLRKWNKEQLVADWNTFSELMYLYEKYSNRLTSDIKHDPFWVLRDYYQRGYYDLQDFVSMFVPALDYIAQKLNNMEHSQCCE